MVWILMRCSSGYDSIVFNITPKDMIKISLDGCNSVDLYSITDSQCNISNDVIVLVKGEVKSVKLQIMKIQIE